jgi:hypothetical protein
MRSSRRYASLFANPANSFPRYSGNDHSKQFLIKSTSNSPVPFISRTLFVSNLDKLVAEFFSHRENRCVRRLKRTTAASDLEHAEICVALGRRLTIP